MNCWILATTLTFRLPYFMSSAILTCGFRRAQPNRALPIRRGRGLPSITDGHSRHTATSGTASMRTQRKLKRLIWKLTRTRASNSWQGIFGDGFKAPLATANSAKFPTTTVTAASSVARSGRAG